jgi:CheY-like chemotaxis protein
MNMQSAAVRVLEGRDDRRRPLQAGSREAARDGSAPAAAACRPPAQPHAADPHGNGTERGCRSVLVVEDNLINQKILVAFLRKRGYQVDVAGDGAEAVQRLAEKRYSLVLMDLQMPVLDGFEATRLIRSLPQIADVPIVAVSAHALNGEPRRCLEAGMNGYLAKPVEPAELYAWVERFAGAPPAC